MADNANEFLDYVRRLDIDQPALCILLGLPRSTLNKWINGTVTQIPQVAVTAIRMLWFMRESDEKLFEKWAIVQDFGVTADYAANDKAQLFLQTIKREPSSPIKKILTK
ncbi:hypothetical protein [Rahnella woolbedingensis]|uniref:Uncharacterized protein n=1 Tax=Rahnella woolbedingensis TaxID=1510574 RepID=A0A419NEI1_9GAMM|nr:hypothetical protein [Rahnella woolbedingensis]RJT47162.1 hypothetical protein D6C13_02020 [Rahnella woolbedingensis]